MYIHTQPPSDSAIGAPSPRRLSTLSFDESPSFSEERLFETEGWEGEADVSDWEPFRLLGRSMIDYIANYYQQVEGRAVGPSVEPGYLKVSQMYLKVSQMSQDVQRSRLQFWAKRSGRLNSWNYQLV